MLRAEELQPHWSFSLKARVQGRICGIVSACGDVSKERIFWKERLVMRSLICEVQTPATYFRPVGEKMAVLRHDGGP